MKLSSVLFKDSIIYGFVKYLSLISAILLTPIYTRIISKESYGIMELYNTWIILLISCLPLGMTTAILKYYPDSKNDKKILKDVLGTIFFSIIILSFGFLLISFVFQQVITSYYIGEVNKMVNIVYWQSAIIIILSIFEEYSLNILRSEFKKYQYLFVSILKFLILTGVGFYLVYYANADFEGFYRASVIASIAATLFAFVFTKKHINFIFKWTLLKKILKFSIHFISVFILFQINNLIDRFLINEYIDLESVGIYSIGARIANMANIIYSSFTLAWYPFAMSLKENKHIHAVFNTVHKVFIVLSLFIILVIGLFRNELIFIFAPDYKDAYYLILILLISNIFASASFVYSLGLHISNKTKYLTYAAFFSVLTHIAISFLTIQQFGIIGIAIGSLVGSLVWVTYQYFYAQVFYFIKFEIKYFIWFFLTIAMIFTFDFLFNLSSLKIDLVIVLVKGFLIIILMIPIFIFIRKILKEVPLTL